MFKLYVLVFKLIVKLSLLNKLFVNIQVICTGFQVNYKIVTVNIHNIFSCQHSNYHHFKVFKFYVKVFKLQR